MTKLEIEHVYVYAADGSVAVAQQPRRRRSKVDVVEMVRLFRDEDATLQQIADVYDVTRERIRQLLNEVDPNAATERRLSRRAARLERVNANRPACIVCGVKVKGGKRKAKFTLCHQHGHTGLRGPLIRLLDPERQASHTAPWRAARVGIRR